MLRKGDVYLAAISALCFMSGCTQADIAGPNSVTLLEVVDSSHEGGVGSNDDVTSRVPETATDGSPSEGADETDPKISSTADELIAMGVVLSDGFAPHAHLGRTDGMLNWPPKDNTPEAVGDPPVPEGLGPLQIHAVVEHCPLSCVEYSRTIVNVNAGHSHADQSIARQIEEVAREEHQRFHSWFNTEEDCGDVDARIAGNTY